MPFNGDPLAFWGKRIIEEHHVTLLKQLPKIKFESGLPDPLELSDEDHRFLPQLKVGILGAGISGLYTALILDSLDIEYEILEASDRVGGRIATYRFPGGGKYDYYDQGAMRFPLPKKDDEGKYRNGIMKRLAELVEYGPLNEGPDPLKDTLIPYYFDARDSTHPCFFYLNGVFQKMETDRPKGDFNAQGMGVNNCYIQAGSKAIFDDVINPFVRVLINDYETGSREGWEAMKENDLYSVRGYMATRYLPSNSLLVPPRHLSPHVIDWTELLEDSTSAFDRALSEAVFTALAFADVDDEKYGNVDWRCFDGGSETLINKMESYINSRGDFVHKNRQVTGIHEDIMVVSIPEDYTTPTSTRVTICSPEIDVDVCGGCKPRKNVIVPCVGVTVNGSGVMHYSHVISTLPLPVLRTIDLTGAGLNALQNSALRGLDHGPSIKIAVLFKSNWWTTKLGIIGGQSSTDLPVRTIVYPSYGVDSDAPSRVLVASYTWTTDAFRLGALAAKEDKRILKDLVLRNLAEVHYHQDASITYDYLCDQYEDMHVKDWNNDEYAMGAFALFSPGEFENLYASLNVPAANGRLHFAGEAISTRHGWAVGALDSAWRAVYEYLKITGQSDKITKFKEIWNENVEWTTPSTEGGSEHDMLDQHVRLTQMSLNLPPQ